MKEALNEACAFGRRLRGITRAIWNLGLDLRNELLYSAKADMVTPGNTDEARMDSLIKEGWPDYLQVRYQSLDLMTGFMTRIFLLHRGSSLGGVGGGPVQSLRL